MTTTDAAPGIPAEARTEGPTTLPEIATRIADVRDEIAAWFADAPLDDLFHRRPEEWAAMDDLRHLVRVNAAVVKGLGFPRVVLRVRFGRPARRPWSYHRLATIYDALLSTGVKSPAPFEPRSGVVADRAAYRDRVLGQWQAVNQQLLDRVGRLTEKAADRAGLPHPGLGVLSLREMLYFTVHHDLHHLGVARRRVARKGAAP